MSATAYDGTAEIWSAKDKMGDSRVLVTMDMSLLGTKLQTSADKTVTVEKDKVKAINHACKEGCRRQGNIGRNNRQCKFNG